MRVEAGESHAVFRQRVEVRRLDLAAEHPHVRVAHVIAQDDDDVRPAGLVLRPRQRRAGRASATAQTMPIIVDQPAREPMRLTFMSHSLPRSTGSAAARGDEPGPAECSPVPDPRTRSTASSRSVAIARLSTNASAPASIAARRMHSSSWTLRTTTFTSGHAAAAPEASPVRCPGPARCRRRPRPGGAGSRPRAGMPRRPP